MTERLYESHEGADDAAFTLFQAVSDTGEFDLIIGISRGGLPLAVRLSHHLDVPMGVADVTHYEGERMREVQIDSTGLDKVSPGDRVLLVEDIVDTGYTLKHLLERWDQAKNFDYVTASWHKGSAPVVTPDYWVKETDAWVVYPWEV